MDEEVDGYRQPQIHSLNRCVDADLAHLLKQSDCGSVAMGNANLTARGKWKSGSECPPAVTFHLGAHVPVPVFSRHRGWTLRRCCTCCCFPREPCLRPALWKPHRPHPNEGWHCCWRSHNSGPGLGRWRSPWPGIWHAHTEKQRGCEEMLTRMLRQRSRLLITAQRFLKQLTFPRSFFFFFNHLPVMFGMICGWLRTGRLCSGRWNPPRASQVHIYRASVW